MQRVLVRSVQGAIQTFQRANAAHPTVVQTVAGGSFWAIGNIITQTNRKPQARLDRHEIAVYSSYGSLLSNVGHTWYRHLHVFTNRTMRMTSWQSVATKLFADLVLFNVAHCTALISWVHVANGGMPWDIAPVLRSQLYTFFTAEAAIWTPVQLLNFTVMPPQHQQMFVNLVAIVEAAIMSWIGGSH